MRRLAVVAPVLLALAAPARADEAALARELEAFDGMALWHDNKVPVPTRKWTGKVRYAFTGLDPGGWRAVVAGGFARIAELTGLDIAEVAPGQDDNFVVQFEETSAYFIGGRAAGCYASTSFHAGTGAIARAELHVNFAERQGLRRCILHELVHGVGFPGHPHDVDSILSYTFNRDAFTALDEAALRTLYDRRIGANWYHLPALLAARQVIAERLGLVAAGASTAHLARPFLDSAVGWLRRSGDAGDVFAQVQLGNAYWLGQHVAVDAAEARRWWRRAADAGSADAAFGLGVAALTGAGGADRSDDEALRWFRAAAKGRHPTGTYNVGAMIEAGRGAPADPVEACAWYRVAAERGDEKAASGLERVEKTLAPDARERARARAAAIAAGE